MSHQKRRLKKLQRHRKKRDAKRKALRKTADVIELVDVGLPKVSETLVAFAEPLTEALPEDAPEQIEGALLLAALVWNLVVKYDDPHEEEQELERVGKMLASKTGISEAASIANVRWLAERKRKHFGYDRRMVLDVRTYDDDGQLRVMAAAAMPSDGASP